MKWIATLVLVAGAACDSDNVVEGTNARCAFGGAINDCPDAERTSEGVCWRLVDCAVIPVDNSDPNGNDWGTCVDDLDQLTEDRRRIVIDCVAAATCDALRTDPFCGEFPR